MQRTNQNSYLVIIDGMDGIDKEMLVDWIYTNNPIDFIVYKSRNNNLQLTYKDIQTLHHKFPDKYIITSNIDINSDLYRKCYKDSLEDIFNGNVLTYILLWEDFADFFGNRNNYNMQKFLKDKELFYINGNKDNAKYININTNALPSDVYNKFKLYFETLY